MAAALWGRQWTGSYVCFHVDNLAVVSILNKRSAKDPLLSHLLRCLFFFSAFYKFHFSAEHIPGSSNTAADALSRDNIHVFSLLVPQVLQATVPSSIQELLLLEAPDWTSPRWTSLFCLSLPRDLLPPHLRHNRSGIRQYTAFCWQFGLTPLPLSDLNLCRFVSYLHQQQLSPASVHLYLAALCYLQIVAVGHDPQPGVFPRLQYAVWAFRWLTPSRSRPLRLPITQAILRSLNRRWSPPPVSRVVCCGLPAVSFFAFLQSGEFTCPSSAAYNSSMLSWGNIQVDSLLT